MRKRAPRLGSVFYSCPLDARRRYFFRVCAQSLNILQQVSSVAHAQAGGWRLPQGASGRAWWTAPRPRCAAAPAAGRGGCSCGGCRRGRRRLLAAGCSCGACRRRFARAARSRRRRRRRRRPRGSPKAMTTCSPRRKRTGPAHSAAGTRVAARSTREGRAARGGRASGRGPRCPSVYLLVFAFVSEPQARRRVLCGAAVFMSAKIRAGQSLEV